MLIKRLFIGFCLAGYLIAVAGCSSAQSVDLARSYYDHGLNDKAKDILIGIANSSASSPVNKAKALYVLGQISFDEGRIKAALSDWQLLAHNYPETAEGKEIGGRLKQLNEIVGKISDENVTSAIAKSYISSGDFWSKADRRFTIDSSWMPRVEMASEWYDRVIQEFPKSDAAEIAYERKLFTLIGGRVLGEEGTFGVQSDYKKYMPQLLETFSQFEVAFPKNSYLQGFRYQIAQAYWSHRDWENTRVWLQKIIEKGEGNPTFYTETAKARLQKVEY